MRGKSVSSLLLLLLQGSFSSDHHRLVLTDVDSNSCAAGYEALAHGLRKVVNLPIGVEEESRSSKKCTVHHIKSTIKRPHSDDLLWNVSTEVMFLYIHVQKKP